jgi:hypothetical protein
MTSHVPDPSNVTRPFDVPRCPSCSASMTTFLGRAPVSRCDGCGSVWLEAPCRTVLATVGLDEGARALALRGSHPQRHRVRSPYRAAREHSGATLACPLCRRALRAEYVHDADVTVHACEHGVLVAREQVAAFLLASDIRRSIVEVARDRASAPVAPVARRPGGILLRIGAAIFVVSLVLPAVSIDVVLAFGYAAALYGPLFAWELPVLAAPVLANLLALVLLVVPRRIQAGWAALFAGVFTVGTLCAVFFGLSGMMHTHFGYWVWCLALALLAIGTALRSTSPRAFVG